MNGAMRMPPLKIARGRRAAIRVISLGFLLAAALVAAHQSTGAVVAQALGAAAFPETALGLLDKIACVGCVAGFVIGAGTTVAGLAVVLASEPEIAILCVSTCTVAMS
jgi:hypothetical protein